MGDSAAEEKKTEEKHTGATADSSSKPSAKDKTPTKKTPQKSKKEEAVAAEKKEEAAPPAAEKKEETPKPKSDRKRKAAEPESAASGEEEEAEEKKEETTLERGGRVRKAVEKFDVSDIKKKPEMYLGEGEGTALGKIRAVSDAIFAINKRKGVQDEVTLLHRLLFCHVDEMKVMKENLNAFNGIAGPKKEKELSRISANLSNKTIKDLSVYCRFLGLERSGLKNDLCERILNFLKSPEKVAKAKKMTSGGTNAYMVFAGAKRKEVSDQNGGMSVPEVAKILGQMWKEMSADEKQPYEEEAKRLKAAKAEDADDDDDYNSDPKAKTPTSDKKTKSKTSSAKKAKTSPASGKKSTAKRAKTPAKKKKAEKKGDETEPEDEPEEFEEENDQDGDFEEETTKKRKKRAKRKSDGGDSKSKRNRKAEESEKEDEEEEKDDPADEGLRQKIRAIIEKSDVSTISMKKIRTTLAEEGVDVEPIKDQIAKLATREIERITSQ